MMPNSKKLVIEDIYVHEIELTDTEAQCINGGSTTLPLAPLSRFSLEQVALNPQPLPPG